MKELWIGVVELLTEPTEDEGDTRAFTNVVTWAESISDYIKTVTEVLSRYGWVFIESKNVRLLSQRDTFSEEINEIVERARSNPNACIFATLHYFPSLPN